MHDSMIIGPIAGRPASARASIDAARRSGRLLWTLALAGAATLGAIHLALAYTVLGGIDVRLVLVDVGIAALALAPAGWYIGALTEERQRHAAQRVLLHLLATPQNITDTATGSLQALVHEGLAQAAVVALTEDDGVDVHMLAATGFPEGWVRHAPSLRLDGGAAPSVTRDGEPHAWVAALDGAYGAHPAVARVPLTTGGEVVGVLVLIARRPPRTWHGGVLATIGAQLSAALDHAALYDAAYRRERMLEEQDQRRREFIAAISHEIRTPLQSIQAFADLLGMSAEGLDADAGSLVASVTTGVDRLNRLVGDLIDLGRSDAQAEVAHPAEADVRDALRAAEAVLRPAFLLREQTLHLDVPDRPLHAVLDHRQLEHVVLNVLSNANRHAPAGGDVALRAHRTEDGAIRIEVEDSGPGIPPEERRRVFEPYYRVQAADGTAVPGSGLGLAIARRLVELQGGRIWVEEGETGGARFCIEVRATSERE